MFITSFVEYVKVPQLIVDFQHLVVYSAFVRKVSVGLR
jgi:hypothetical protein